jgi:hypothetical protein
MSVHVAAGTQHTYRANQHDTVLSEVATVQCILMPRAFLVAGFDEGGQVVMVQYRSYAATDPAWEPHFYEHEFMTETLLGVPDQVKAIFIGSSDAMLIPESLYDEKATRSWMERLFAIAPNDVLHTNKVATPDAQYVYALPESIDKLLHRYFGDTPIMPVAAYQFYKPGKSGNVLQCLIAEDSVIASLHQQGKLLWHQQFGYQTAEDIAWQASQLCRELQIPRVDLNIQCTMLCDSSFELVSELERYFPKIKWSVGTPTEGDHWAPVVYLLQQLYACAL